MKLKTTLLAAALFSLPLSSALALDGEQLYNTKTCFACHGKDDNSPILPIYPKLAGQNRDYIAAQMNDIKSGARANGQSAAMKGVMHLVSEEEVDAIADYLAALAP